MKDRSQVRLILIVMGLNVLVLMFGYPRIAFSSLIYFNDGTANDFDQVFGDVDIDVPWNASFGPGGFMDGTSDDIPPFNTITNRGLVTLQGAAGGAAGGGFMRRVTNVEKKANGVIIFTYGTQGQQKAPQGSYWEANVRAIGTELGIDPQDAVNQWRTNRQVTAGKITVKIVRYLGDPVVSIPPDDLLAAQLDPIDLGAVSAAVANDNTFILFWEVTGSREMEAIDLLFGDFEMNTGYQDLLHHYPYLAVLNDVGPSDFGLDPAEVTNLTFNGDSLPGTDPFSGAVFIATFDPVVPEPSSLVVFSVVAAIGITIGWRERRRKTGQRSEWRLSRQNRSLTIPPRPGGSRPAPAGRSR